MRHRLALSLLLLALPGHADEALRAEG